MATTLENIAEALARAERDQKIRDEALRRAFGILTEAINRGNSVLDLIHQEATEARQAAEHVQQLLLQLPGQIREAMEGVFETDEADDPR